jgi:hypothetical protein
MRKSNGKTEAEMAGLDLEHELPPAEEDDRNTGTSGAGSSAGGETSGIEAELQKVKAV